MNLRLQHSALSRTESSDGHCCQSVAAAARLNVCSSVAAVVAVWLEMYGVEACNANFWGRNCSSSEVTQQMCAFIIIFMVGVFPNDVRFHSTLHYGKKHILPTPLFFIGQTNSLGAPWRGENSLPICKFTALSHHKTGESETLMGGTCITKLLSIIVRFEI